MKIQVDGHIPKNGYTEGAILCNGEHVYGCGTDKEFNEEIRLYHCRYKGYTEYKNKMKDKHTVSDIVPHEKHFKFDELI